MTTRQQRTDTFRSSGQARARCRRERRHSGDFVGRPRHQRDHQHRRNRDRSGPGEPTTGSGQGKQTISAGGTAQRDPRRWSAALSSGGTATATTVSNGGFQQIGSGAIAIWQITSAKRHRAFIRRDRQRHHASGNRLQQRLLSAFAGGVATGTTVGSGGRENVFPAASPTALRSRRDVAV